MRESTSRMVKRKLEPKEEPKAEIDRAKEIEHWPLAKVKPYKRNAKLHPPEQVEAIAEMIKAHGFDQPIVVDTKGVIIKGHGRLLAAKRLSMPTVPVIVRDLPPGVAAAARLGDNRFAEFGWDIPTLTGDVVANLSDSGFKLELTGFTLQGLGLDGASEEQSEETSEPEEAREEASEEAPPEPVADEIDNVPAPPKKARVKEGDVWKLGDHVLVCGDSFLPESLELAGIEAGDVDLVVTDPPYAIYGSSTGIGADIADDKMVRPFFEQLFKLVAQVLKEFGHSYFCTDWRSWAAMWEAAKRAGLSVKNGLVWDKGGGGLGSNYANCHELVAFVMKLPPATAMKSTTKRGIRSVHDSNILRYSRVTGDERQHNAAKPVAMMERLVNNSSDEGALVVDFFGGSGSTLLACERTKRRCAIFEIEPKYCDVILSRWEALTGKEAVRSKQDKR